MARSWRGERVRLPNVSVEGVRGCLFGFRVGRASFEGARVENEVAVTRVFRANPRRRALELSDADLATLCAESADCFSDLPPHHLGESVHIRRTSVPGLLIQRMVPSLNSITFERKGTVVGTDRLRLDISEIFWSALHHEGSPPATSRGSTTTS
jgi:hypothetical protein